jgi:hypothetical protein
VYGFLGRNATDHTTNIANSSNLGPKYQVGFDVPEFLTRRAGWS